MTDPKRCLLVFERLQSMERSLAFTSATSQWSSCQTFTKSKRPLRTTPCQPDPVSPLWRIPGRGQTWWTGTWTGVCQASSSLTESTGKNWGGSCWDIWGTLASGRPAWRIYFSWKLESCANSWRKVKVKVLLKNSTWKNTVTIETTQILSREVVDI